jgi:hypothetical protein
LSTIVSVPVREPPAVGPNASAIEQFEPAASEVPQVFVCAKSPVAEMLEMESEALPVFVTVMVCVALVVPTYWLPKVRLDEDSVTAGCGVVCVCDLLLPQAS